MTFKIYKKYGFTLLETMVAIAVLLIAVVGPISIIGKSLQNIYFARDQMVAINLAQEGIEAVRQRRDTNFLNGSTWDSGFGSGDCQGGFTCLIDATLAGLPSPSIIKCAAPCADTKVYIDGANGTYHQYLSVPVGKTPTNFTRKVDTVVSANEDKVTSTVTWRTGGLSGSITVSENIFKWAL
jgi:prepilin-type N-terminal cleavage/methylation domain-containing protein